MTLVSVTTTLVSGLAYFYFHLDHNGPIVADDFVALFVFLPIALLANVFGRQARRRAIECEERREEADAAAALAGRLARQQAALRRVATLVARGLSPELVYPATVTELSHGLDVNNVLLVQYGPDGATVVVDGVDQRGDVIVARGVLLPVTGDSVTALIHTHGRPARIDGYLDASGTTAWGAPR